MNAPVRIFAQHAEEYASAGLPAFPVDTRNKKPIARGWLTATPAKARAWALNERLGSADGLGIVMGKSTGITEIDVDAVGDAWLARAIEQFGETPITIRTASGKHKLWYRHNGECRKIRPFEGQPVDVFGGGFSIAPPSWREDLAASYTFQQGGLHDLEHLPAIRSSARLDRAAEGILNGARNESLFRYCMVQARYCDDLETLVDVAATWASAFPDPLSAKEVERCAKSAWGYEADGRNFLGLHKPQTNERDREMDALIDQPNAYALYQLLRRWHSNRSHFAVAPTAMAEAGSPPWSRHRIGRARDVLVERGFIAEVAAPDKRRMKAGRYCFPIPVARNGNNHNTPSLRTLET